ncbi:MAG: aldehyde dehydrogenase family protein, partial [Myxococcota bacterium]|nr:aldehyde dehydrogenase family protein [Myxococcota bacterium]
TFPTWNAYPSLFANLATGNAVVVKPHPNGILPMAIAVQTCRKTLAALGFDPNLVTLAADESSKPITHRLLNHPLTKIIDFTGNPSFGAWLEENHYRKLIYTETAGCNSVVIESTPNYSGMIQAIAQSLALFSSQMCTSAQNIFIPKTGITSNGKHISFQEIVDDLVKTVDQMVAEPKAAAALCGAVMSKRTIFEVNSLRDKARTHGQLYRDSKPYPHPDFPQAQTATPLIVGLDIDKSFLYRKEHFGPMSFIIASNSAEQALQQAAKDAQECGSISCYAYSQSPAFQDQIEETFFQAGSSVGINLIRHRPINFAAAYSDFHVTGLNPAGNACLTDISFVASRFRIVQSKREQLQS